MRGLYLVLRLRVWVVWKHDMAQLDGDGDASSNVETDSVAIPLQGKLQTQQIRENKIVGPWHRKAKMLKCMVLLEVNELPSVRIENGIFA